MMHGPAIVKGIVISVRADTTIRRGPSTPSRRPSPRHIGPLMPPSLRTRQKWIAISSATASGIATQCSM